MNVKTVQVLEKMLFGRNIQPIGDFDLNVFQLILNKTLSNIVFLKCLKYLKNAMIMSDTFEHSKSYKASLKIELLSQQIKHARNRKSTLKILFCLLVGKHFILSSCTNIDS